MKMELDKIIELDNGNKYLTLMETSLSGIYYYYVALVNEMMNDIVDDYKIITLKKANNDLLFEDIVTENSLKEILPLFLEQIKE